MNIEKRRHIIRFKKILISAIDMTLLAMFTVLVVVVLRIFLFASFKIPSSSMEPTLLPGDFIIANKLIPGPRMDWWPGKKDDYTYRIKGIRTIKRNDVLIFNDPYHNSNSIKKNLNSHYIKRCIAIPGDTFYIKNGIYKIKNSSDKLGYYRYQKEIINYPELKEFKPKMFNGTDWTITFFGPIYIPGAETTIILDSINIKLYKNLIEYETQKTLTTEQNIFYIDGVPLQKYTFRQNYYFVAGDFAFNSKDSRYWGLLPEDFIVAKASFIWKSKCPDTGKYRFNRFFKTIN
ncbi:MAG: signal peptidase I [Tannerellaceae bacterium]|nr:signal peptidase I [Tannerellaceae bacterium]